MPKRLQTHLQQLRTHRRGAPEDGPSPPRHAAQLNESPGAVQVASQRQDEAGAPTASPMYGRGVSISTD